MASNALIAALIKDVSEGLEVLRARDGVELTVTQIAERARGIVAGLVGNYFIVSLDETPAQPMAYWGVQKNGTGCRPRSKWRRILDSVAVPRSLRQPSSPRLGCAHRRRTGSVGAEGSRVAGVDAEGGVTLSPWLLTTDRRERWARPLFESLLAAAAVLALACWR